MPKVGELVPLSHQLWDGETAAVVHAVVRLPDGTEIAGSPYNMPHIGNGKYRSNSLFMPNVSRLDVTYECFDDIAKTIPCGPHTIGTDVFDRTPELQDVVRRDTVIGIIREKKGVLSKIVKIPKVCTVVVNPAICQGVVNEKPLLTQVKNDPILKGVVECP